jgi:hypothetical protein
MFNLSWRELIRLAAVLERNRGHRLVRAKPSGRCSSRPGDGVIPVTHQHDTIEMRGE